MAVRKILQAPDPILRQKAKRVPALDRSVQKLIDDMIDTVHAAHGAGLAAPQVGVSLRLCVVDVPDENNPDRSEVLVLVNPEIVKRAGERIVSEGCLSLAGYQGEVKRSVNVTVKAFNRHGKPIRIKGTELLAQALEHELDHLNGVLYIDKLEPDSQFFRLVPAKEGADGDVELEEVEKPSGAPGITFSK